MSGPDKPLEGQEKGPNGLKLLYGHTQKVVQICANLNANEKISNATL